MKYKPHQHVPLLLFGLAAAPLSAVGLFQAGDLISVEFAAFMAIFGACALVMGTFTYWRHG